MIWEAENGILKKGRWLIINIQHLQNIEIKQKVPECWERWLGQKKKGMKNKQHIILKQRKSRNPARYICKQTNKTKQRNKNRTVTMGTQQHSKKRLNSPLAAMFTEIIETKLLQNVWMTNLILCKNMV